MDSQPCSPSADPVPYLATQSTGRPPAKGPRGLEPSFQDLPGALAAGTLISLLLLAEDSALQVFLDDFDLVLEPQPTAALRICLPGHTLILIPEALMSWAEGQAGSSQGGLPDDLELRAFLGPNGEVLTIQLGALHACFPEEPRAPTQGPNPYPGPWAHTPNLHRSSEGPSFSLRLHLPQDCLSSALQPLPASPSPEAQMPAKSFPGRPRSKARRRLFQE